MLLNIDGVRANAATSDNAVLRHAAEQGHLDIVDCLKEAMRPDGIMEVISVMTPTIEVESTRTSTARSPSVRSFVGRLFRRRKVESSECDCDTDFLTNRATF